MAGWTNLHCVANFFFPLPFLCIAISLGFFLVAMFFLYFPLIVFFFLIYTQTLSNGVVAVKQYNVSFLDLNVAEF